MTDPAQLYHQLIDTFNRRAWQQAQLLTSQLLPLAPHQPTVHYIAGICSMEMRQLSRAVEHLCQATNLAPGRADFLTQYARALSLARLSAEAVVIADRALALSPDDPLALDILGVVYSQANAHERAAEMFGRAAALLPTRAHLRFNLATSLIYAGDIDSAEVELEACLTLNPEYWKAHLTLAQLRKQTLAKNHLERLQTCLPKIDDDAAARLYVNLALAKEFEDLEDYPKAFRHLALGKAAARADRNYSIKRDESLFEALMHAFPAPQMGSGGCPSNEPIFVIGMPRSGTTLVERIISSHPEVYSAGELQDFGVSLKRASGSCTPHMLDPDTIARGLLVNRSQLGESYLSSTRPATGARQRFIDKLPHNFLYAGFIANALPNAKIICLRRDPMDTCLSNFRQLFAQTSPYYDYSFDLLDTGRYYILFERLMTHWQKVLPGRILELSYETLVDSQEDSSRKLLEYCGLSWHDACLSFEDNPTPVATASAVQVRVPIYRSALRRWRKYESQLDGLRQLLLDAGIELAD